MKRTEGWEKGGARTRLKHEGYGESGNILSRVPSIHPKWEGELKVVLSSTKLRLKKTLEYSMTKSTYNSLSPRLARFSLPIISPLQNLQCFLSILQDQLSI